jgi:type II secretory pathway pseudopilin PulG
LKYLVVIALIALLLALLLRRLRPYLQLVQEFIKTLRHFQQAISTGANPRQKQSEKLVCCETCGTWIPSGRAVSVRSRAVFCSEECRENSGRKKQRAS